MSAEPRADASGEAHVLDRHFCDAIARLANETDPWVLRSLMLASRQTRDGHVCVDLSSLATKPLPEPNEEQCWPGLEEWLGRLRASSVVGDGSQPTPLVLDQNRLYLHRYWEHERKVAELLAQRTIEEGGTLLGPGGVLPGEADPEQDRALGMALSRRLSIISGGPGTGKTSLVVRLLAALQARALEESGSPLSVLLLAPTGKAAHRLSEAVGLRKQELACTEKVRESISENAATIHRALGVIRGSATRFRHHAAHPLLVDVVVIDEASMVDIALMRRLVEALPSRAKLIVLGDRHQLVSVEAGSVLSDICQAAGEPGSPMGPCFVELLKSYRFREDHGIARFASAVRRGDADQAIAELEAGHADLTHVAAAGDSLTPLLLSQAVERYRPLLTQSDHHSVLRALDSFRILCAHRHGTSGVVGVNRSIERTLGVPRASTSYRGRPILVTQNAPDVALFNGDTGVVLPDQAGSLRAFFSGPDGQLRRLSPARLPEHESVFAMSIHKSQGSEFDEVAVLLPDENSPLLTRELLYTAVTRARNRVFLFASIDSVRRAVMRPIARASGLAVRLASAEARKG